MTESNDIGLVGLFGRERWVPSGSNAGTETFKNAFESMIKFSEIDQGDLLKRVPSFCENVYEFGPRAQRGFKFVWNDLDGLEWSVHGHEPDAGAKSGEIGGERWTCRISYKLSRSSYPDVIPYPELPYRGAPLGKSIMLVGVAMKVSTGPAVGMHRWYHTNQFVGSSHLGFNLKTKQGST